MEEGRQDREGKLAKIIDMAVVNAGHEVTEVCGARAWKNAYKVKNVSRTPATAMRARARWRNVRRSGERGEPSKAAVEIVQDKSGSPVRRWRAGGWRSRARG